VFVPHIFREDAPNAIFQFRFDAATGALTPNDSGRCAPNGPDGPRHFRFHPTKNIVYVSNEQGCSVTVYAMDPNAGTLSPLQTISTLSEDWAGESKCSQIRLTPDGQFLYAPNRGHDTIAEFAIDPDTGLLTAMGHAIAEKTLAPLRLILPVAFYYQRAMHPGALPSTVSTKTLAASRARLRMSWATSQCG
jgi:6-phosphogluconolactonase